MPAFFVDLAFRAAGFLIARPIDLCSGSCGTQLAGKLQERYGYAKERAEREADEFAATLGLP